MLSKDVVACSKWRVRAWVGPGDGLTGTRARPNPTPKLDDEGNIDRKVSARGEEIEEGKRDEPTDAEREWGGRGRAATREECNVG